MMGINYAIKCGDKWVQTIETNENYVSCSKAPTMGGCHSHSEYKTVLSKNPSFFERLTAINYARVILEEFRWGDSEEKEIRIIPESKMNEYGQQENMDIKAVIEELTFCLEDGRCLMCLEVDKERSVLSCRSLISNCLNILKLYVKEEN